MNKKKVGIVTECVCDLPKSVLNSHGIDIIYFIIEMDSGVFTDTDEVTAENVISYMESGGIKSTSAPPSPEAYKKVYEKNLKKYDEIIHIAISSKISKSCETAYKALEQMDESRDRVHVYDSGHLSSGMGFLVQRGAELADLGYTADKIIEELDELKPRIFTSFIARNADYLNRKGLVSDFTKKICSLLKIHPVLYIKNGNLKLEKIIIGNYDSSCKFYIRSRVKGKHNIDTKRAFITHVGCSIKMLRSIREETAKYCSFDELNTVAASATISGCCGPDTFGLLFIRSES